MSHTLNYILKVSQALLFVSYLSSCNSIQNRKNFLSYKLPKPCALHVKSIYDFGRLPLLYDHIYVYYPGRYLYIYVNGFIASVSALLFIIIEEKSHWKMIFFIETFLVSPFPWGSPLTQYPLWHPPKMTPQSSLWSA